MTKQRLFMLLALTLAFTALWIVPQQSVHANVIGVITTAQGIVSYDECSLAEAIQPANDDDAINDDCVSGSGAYAIELLVQPDNGGPAINAVPVVDCTDSLGSLLLTDQRGIARPQGFGCDIGAFGVAEADLPITVDLSIAKSVDNPAPNEGSSIVYTITLTNTSASTPATSVVVTDVLPIGVTYVSDDGGSSYADSTVIWTIDTLATSTSAMLNITAFVDFGTSGTTITNIAAITTLDQIDTNSDFATISVIFNSNPVVDEPIDDITVNQDSVPSVVDLSSVFSDPDDDALALSVASNDNAGLVAASLDGMNLTLSYAPGQSGQATIVVHATDPGGLFAEDTFVVTVNALLDLEIVKSVDNFAPIEGQTITYTITLTNNSISTPATSVVVTDVLPFSVTYTSDDGGGAYSDGTGIWDVGALAASASVTLTITAFVDFGTSETTITNIAAITALDQIDTNPDNDSDFALVTVILPPPPPPPQLPPEIAVSVGSLSFAATSGQTENPNSQPFQIRNAGGGSLRWEANSNASWLTLSPLSGRSTSLSFTVTASVNISGLNAGVHTAQITVVGADASNSPQTVEVTLVVEVPLPTVILEARDVVEPEAETHIATSDGQVQLTISAGALPPEISGSNVEIEVKLLDTETVPEPPEKTTFVYAVEVNTLIDGVPTEITYIQPVELAFTLKAEHLALVNGNVSELGVVWFNSETGEWEPIPVIYESTPPPAGRLMALLNHFSVYALSAAEQPAATPTPVPLATPTPTATATPVPTPSPTFTPTPTVAAPTATPVPATPTPTPSPTFTPTAIPQADATPAPTPTLTPAPLALAAVVTPTPVFEWFIEPESEGSGLNTVILFAILGMAVVLGVAGFAQVVFVRRRSS